MERIGESWRAAGGPEGLRRVTRPWRLLLVACAACAGACASAPPHEAPYAADYVSADGAPPMVDPVAPRSSADAGQEAGSCVFVATGCSCDVENERVYCGTVHEQ